MKARPSYIGGGGGPYGGGTGGGAHGHGQRNRNRPGPVGAVEGAGGGFAGKVQFTGLAQILGQVQASNRNFYSNCWASL
jgi:hypothetical protein